MKAFLIAAGLLMTGASVYGVVDYNKKTKDKEFKELYKEKPAPVEEVTVDDNPVAVPVVEKNEVKKGLAGVKGTAPVKKPVVKKKVVKKKEERVFKIREFSRGRLG